MTDCRSRTQATDAAAAAAGMWCVMACLMSSSTDVTTDVDESWLVSAVITTSQRNVSSRSVNVDIAFIWEWSKFDPPQNPNPLIDCDKTLHNWLCPWDKLVTQNWYKSAVRKRLAKYVKYKASLFYFFPRTRVLKWPVGRFWRTMAQITRNDVGCAFLGSARRPTTFWGSKSPKPL